MRAFASIGRQHDALGSDVRRAAYLALVLLIRKRIIAAAIELIEADGAESLSLRRLATELGCSVLSLYSLVPSRAALLDAVAEEVISRAGVTAVPGAAWEDQLRAHARALRRIASMYPRCTMIVAGRPAVSATMLRPLETALATLREAGFGGQDTVRIMRALAAYVMGSLLREASVAASLADPDGAAERHRSVRKATDSRQVAGLAADLLEPDTDADFEFGLDLLARAIAALQPTPAGR